MGRLRLRTFIAVPLNESVRRRVIRLRDDLAEADPAVKWVEPDNLHVTLLFLGEVDAREVVDVCRVIRGVTEATPPFAMSIGGLGCFPNIRRPRTFWVGLEEGKDELIGLHATLEEALLKLGGYRREDREFTPHITLGRVKSGDVTAALRARLTSPEDWNGGRQDVDQIHVMSSELLPDGPRYTIVSREKLRGAVDDNS